MAWIGATEEGFTIGDFVVAREVAQIIEIIAIAIIVLGVVVSLTAGLIQWISDDADEAFATFKRYIARGLLIGLDLLIAADVIKTVTLEGTLESALVFGPSCSYPHVPELDAGARSRGSLAVATGRPVQYHVI